MAAEVFSDFCIQFLKVFFAHAVAEYVAIKKGYSIFLQLQLGKLRWRSRISPIWNHTEWKAGPVLSSDSYYLVVNRLGCSLVSDRRSLQAGIIIVAKRVAVGQDAPEMGLWLMGRLGLIGKL